MAVGRWLNYQGNTGGQLAGRLPDRDLHCHVSGDASHRSGLATAAGNWLLGGLTTFSTFSAEVVMHLMEARYGLAAGIAAMHVAGSLLLTVAGIKTTMLLIAIRA